MEALAIVAAVLALVATLALGLCKAAGRARPTPPPLPIEMDVIAALHAEADRLTREHER